MKKTGRRIVSGALLLCVLAGVAALVFHQQRSQNRQAVTAAAVSAVEEDGDYRRICVDGHSYTYNTQITAILYAGLDSQGELETYNRYTIAPRADSIEVVILDHYHKKISILAISRDTIASIGRYTMNGNFRGYYDAQLGYAYTYGDGGKVSCANLVEAVSRLLGGVPIQEYVVTNNGSIAQLNELIGGVTVVVPNNDLVQMYPQLSSGSTVRLDAHNVEAFVRWRDTAIPFSNNGRMERQQAFSCGFFRMFREQVIRQPEEMWSRIQSREACMQTSITKSQYLNLVSFLQEETFSDADYYYLKGEDVQGAEFEELHLNPQQKMQTIAQLFYLEDEEGAA